jgi:hypothetical protein
VLATSVCSVFSLSFILLLNKADVIDSQADVINIPNVHCVHTGISAIEWYLSIIHPPKGTC